MIVTHEGIDYDVPTEIGVWLMEAETRIVTLEGRLAQVETLRLADRSALREIALGFVQELGHDPAKYAADYLAISNDRYLCSRCGCTLNENAECCCPGG